SAIARYIEPVSRYSRSNSFASKRPKVDLPLADGPSIAIIIVLKQKPRTPHWIATLRRGSVLSSFHSLPADRLLKNGSDLPYSRQTSRPQMPGDIPPC